MPYYNRPIEEIEETVFRPVVYGAVLDVIKWLGLPEGLNVLYKGEAEQHKYNNSEINAVSRADMDHNRYIGETFLYLESEITDNEQTLLSTTYARPENKWVFLDQQTQSYMYPTMVTKDITINMQLIGTEKEMERWHVQFKRKAIQSAFGMVHTLAYNYPIPMGYMGLLAEIYKMRQANVPYDPKQTFGEYLKAGFTKPYGAKSNDNDDGVIFVINERQAPIHGHFDFGTRPPRPTKHNDVSMYSMNFSYTFTFDCPETIMFRCPLVIHNQMLPHKFLNTECPPHLKLLIKEGSITQEAFEPFRFNGEGLLPMPIKEGINIPWFDDWKEELELQWYGTLMRVLLRQNPAAPEEILDLTKLHPWKLNPLLQHYMKSEKVLPFLSKPYESIINISLYRWGSLVDMDKLNIDKDLLITAKEEGLNPRALNHLVISFCKDPTTLTDPAIDELRKHPCLFYWYIEMLIPGTIERMGWDVSKCELPPGGGWIPGDGSGGGSGGGNGGNGGSGGGNGGPPPITKPEWELIFPPDDRDKFRHEGRPAHWNLVGYFSIYAHSEKP